MIIPIHYAVDTAKKSQTFNVRAQASYEAIAKPAFLSFVKKEPIVEVLNGILRNLDL
ncbi:MAG: hypothetical protein AB1705_05240 [Verrucomicrobiota bacterium]